MTGGNKTGNDDSERVTSEIKRRYQLWFDLDTSLDTKMGVVLGFILLILVQIILNNEIAKSFSRNISLLLPVYANIHYLINVAEFLTFLDGFILLVCAACIGAIVIDIRLYAKASICEPFNDYRERRIDGAHLDESISMALLHALEGTPELEGNEAKTDAKATGIKIALRLFAMGVAFFVLHFLVIVLSAAMIA